MGTSLRAPPRSGKGIRLLIRKRLTIIGPALLKTSSMAFREGNFAQYNSLTMGRTLKIIAFSLGQECTDRVLKNGVTNQVEQVGNATHHRYDRD